jgi:DNA-binding MarR family transcriptional regulator
MKIKSSKRNGKFPTPQQQVLAKVLRAYERLISGIGEQLKGYGLTATQYNVLRILRGAGPDGLTCGEIRGRMITRHSDITRLLDRIQSHDLITRYRDLRDRRAVRSKITDKGLSLLAKLDEPISRWEREAMSRLDTSRMTLLVDLLDSVANGAHKSGELEE